MNSSESVVVLEVSQEGDIVSYSIKRLSGDITIGEMHEGLNVCTKVACDLAKLLNEKYQGIVVKCSFEPSVTSQTKKIILNLLVLPHNACGKR